jgi:uncharacterized SAM-binding protein YcdF (DUF218 family)
MGIVRRALLLAGMAICGGAGAYGILLAAAKPLLSIPTRVEQADVIVVLGGDGPPRAAAAIALYNIGAAARVLVSGDGDCQDIRMILVEGGVPDRVISVECLSRNTMENAQYSATILQSMQVQRALIVTSWYHSRRALDCFRKVAPNMEFISISVGEHDSTWNLLWGGGAPRVLAEYLKIGWYFLRYGVRP